MADASLVFLVLGLTLVGFVWGRLRYDLVALLSLLACVALGLVEADAAFLGFGHPAVITVAAVLVLSRGFQQSGLVDLIARQALKTGGNTTAQVLALAASVAVLSAFMNNVGALALLLPVAMRMAREHQTPPSLLLMPLAFGSLLGGLMTLIGTPPNIILSTYRTAHLGAPYGMFSFLPVGGLVAAAGVVFLVILGWRLAPRRKGQRSPDELFQTSEYLSELKVTEDSKALGWTLRQLYEACGEIVPVVAVLRGEKRYPAHIFYRSLKEGDVLVVEAGPDEIKMIEEKGGFTLAGGEESAEKIAETEDLQIVEAVIRSESPLSRRSVGSIRLLDRHGLHLLAVARDGARLKQRLSEIKLQAGDVLLLQGGETALSETLSELGCLPLASRELSLGKPRRLILSITIFAAAIGSMLLGTLSAPVALTMAAVAFILANVLPLREAYSGIEWPVIVLLGAMIPVGQALENSGGAAQVADALLALGDSWPPVAALGSVFLVSMLLSNIINNAAAALLMAPIAFKLAEGFEVSADPFLMAVAVSASCAFLTPIGHQSNALVMGPGGYRFSDFWKMGLPLSLLVGAVGLPVILWVWPL